MSLGVAILGAGIFAREEHKPAVEAAPHLTLKAVYSRSLSSVKSLQVDESKVDVYSDDSGAGKSLDDLLSRTDIQGVVIALPITKQPDYIRKALKAGKHVLSEKPIAENIKVASELLTFYRTEINAKNVTWSVAENYRFYNTIVTASEARAAQGRPLTFRFKRHGAIALGGKYIETEWRKTPAYQGGFLLDGGVHYAAQIRSILGKEDPITSISAFTTQIKPYLPPVDTVEGIARTKTGALGTISISFGSTSKGQECWVASEKGTAAIGWDQVIVDDQIMEVKNEGSCVPPEIRAWSEAILNGTTDARLLPEEALADLSIVEALLRSGEQNGHPVDVLNQQW